MKKVARSLFCLLSTLLLGGCIVSYGPAIYNHSGQNVKIFAYEKSKGRLSGIIVTNGTGVHLGFEDEKIYKIEGFADDGSLLMSMSCQSNMFFNDETVLIIEGQPQK